MDVFRGFRLLFVDKDECALQEHNCGPNSICSNTEGSYDCSCKTGFQSTFHDGRDCKGKTFIIVRTGVRGGQYYGL